MKTLAIPMRIERAAAKASFIMAFKALNHFDFKYFKLFFVVGCFWFVQSFRKHE